jgi:UDP-N-acetylmuramoylalanine--D-glutamate ligase
LAYAELVGRPASRETLRRAWDTAPRPEGRFEVFARIGGLIFIDDSIATRVDSVRAALEAAPPPVAWILGGVDKGAPVEELLEVVGRKVRLILALGQDGPRMAEPFRDITEVVEIAESEGKKALRAAVQESLRRLSKGSVLLAPLATSFDQFKDYKERSKVFREAVRQAAEGSGVK